MTDTTTTTEGIADELGIQNGDFITITRGARIVAGVVSYITPDGDGVAIRGNEGVILLEGADVTID